MLQSALTAAVRDELVSRNVAALVKVPVPRAHQAPVWTVEEARAFLESARTANDPFYATYVLMLVPSDAQQPPPCVTSKLPGHDRAHPKLSRPSVKDHLTQIR